MRHPSASLGFDLRRAARREIIVSTSGNCVVPARSCLASGWWTRPLLVRLVERTGSRVGRLQRTERRRRARRPSQLRSPSICPCQASIRVSANLAVRRECGARSPMRSVAADFRVNFAGDNFFVELAKLLFVDLDFGCGLRVRCARGRRNGIASRAAAPPARKTRANQRLICRPFPLARGARQDMCS